ncbi:MAG: DNA-3-methyladenine glycosylase [Polaromonas sp.]|nr:DNA-3-methyladenine glycosylase [Polaromonas sp.]
MTTPNALLADDDCYLALKAKDARFDGSFFTAVTSTGIYCRPVCSVKTPLRKNCRFFRHAAQAESACFRPCLRCRPELAPHSVGWCIQDASFMLAHQAARLLDEPQAWGDEAPSIEKLAERLGVSDRHVRRIFEAQFGVTPLQYLQTRRLLTAKQLLADTDLPITQVALASGFASVRRFNAAFVQHYQLNPTDMRRQSPRPGSEGVTVRLGYRPPYDVAAMLAFFGKRSINAIEFIAGGADAPCAGRTFGIESGGRLHAGWLLATFDEPRSQLVLRVSDSLREVLPLVIRRVRAMFDLDADPAAINGVLQASFPGGDGLRVPGALDGYELAVRAVLGQQITVAAARTLAQRLVDRFGEPIETPWPQLTRLFPAPAVLAHAGGDALGQLGIVKQRQAAIVGIAQAVAGQRLQLHGGADVNATVAALKELPGIGDWTAQYIAMRALRWPDAFPAGDVALHKALGVQSLKNPAKEAGLASSRWKPWRSYAVIRAWSGLLDAATPAPKMTQTLPQPHAIIRGNATGLIAACADPVSARAVNRL